MKNAILFPALVLAGCKGSGGDCTAAIEHSMELSKADMAKMGMDDKALAKAKEIGIQHCKDEKWPDEVVACMKDAKTEGDAQNCYTKLSKEQQDSMQKAVMEMMMAAKPK